VAALAGAQVGEGAALGGLTGVAVGAGFGALIGAGVGSAVPGWHIVYVRH
jgi:hypothetical protein